MMIEAYDIKGCIAELREAEQYGDTTFSSYEAGVLADIIENQEDVIAELMFENESKQNRINKLQAELEQIKKGQLTYGN